MNCAETTRTAIKFNLKLNKIKENSIKLNSN